MNKPAEQPLVAMRTLAHFEGLDLPSYETGQSAGADIRAAISKGEPLTLGPGERALIPAGFAMALPPGFEAQIRPRSGLALKYGITVLNSPGTIDADYRGEVQVMLVNQGREPFEISRGMRIAQMVIAPVTQAQWMATLDLPKTARGSGGFGSTGV